MTKKLFTEEEINKLKASKYVVNATEKAITYSEEFREQFYIMYSSGEKPIEILKRLELDPKILGEKRVACLTSRIKKMAKKEDFSDTRAVSSGRPKTKERTQQQEIDYLKHCLEYQKQQIEALKKMNFVEKKKIWKQQKKNTESSET